MRKIIFLILIPLLFSTVANADLQKAYELYESNKKQKWEWIAYELIDAQYFFAASVFAKRHILIKGEHSSSFEEALETISIRAGTEALSDLPDENMKLVKGATMSLVLGLRYFQQNKYKEAIKILNDVSEHSKFYPEAQLVIGSSYLLGPKDKDYKSNSINAYKKCESYARYQEKKANNEKQIRYYNLVRGNCIVHQARMLYTEKEYQKSSEAYDRIDKQSYRWPYLLIERAWASFQLGDYNRALGLVVTYKSPLLESYFFPEAEVLTALSYHKLCLYEDTLSVVDGYYANYKPKSEQLKKLIDGNKNDPLFFYNLMFKEREQKDQLSPFVNGLTTQIKKELKFNFDLISLRRAEEELKAIEKWPDHALKLDMQNETNMMISHMKKNINSYVLQRMASFYNDIHTMSYELFNIKLDTLTKKRDLLYKGKKLATDRERGSIKYVRKNSTQHFYTFIGEFWADELGDYSFGLESQCLEVDRNKTTNIQNDNIKRITSN